MQLRVRALVESTSWRQPIEALAACLVERRQLGVREARGIIRRAIPISRDAVSPVNAKRLARM
jgi:hypothetical protein